MCWVTKFIGPTLIHFKKDIQMYDLLPSRVIGRNPSFKNVIAFATDGECAIIKSFLVELSDSTLHLLCTIHVEINIKYQLRKVLEYPSGVIKQITGTIFDMDGIIESEDREHFEMRLLSLQHGDC